MSVEISQSRGGIPDTIEEQLSPPLHANVFHRAEGCITSRKELLLDVVGVWSVGICAYQECFRIEASRLVYLAVLRLHTANIADSGEHSVVWKGVAQRKLDIHPILSTHDGGVVVHDGPQLVDNRSVALNIDLVGADNVIELLLRRLCAQAACSVDVMWDEMSLAPDFRSEGEARALDCLIVGATNHGDSRLTVLGNSPPKDRAHGCDLLAQPFSKTGKDLPPPP